MPAAYGEGREICPALSNLCSAGCSRQRTQQSDVKKLKFEQSKIEAENVLEFLQHWFLHHTQGEDRRFSNYLREKGVSL